MRKQQCTCREGLTTSALITVLRQTIELQYYNKAVGVTAASFFTNLPIRNYFHQKLGSRGGVIQLFEKDDIKKYVCRNVRTNCLEALVKTMRFRDI